jgi:hypothetical protein
MPMVAIVELPSAVSGSAYRGLDEGCSTGDDRPAPAGLKRSGRRGMTDFLSRDAKRGTRGGKKLEATVAGRRSRRSAAKSVFGQTSPFEDAVGAV